MPRCVTIGSSPGATARSLARSVFNVRIDGAVEGGAADRPQRAPCSSSRENTRPGRSTSTLQQPGIRSATGRAGHAWKRICLRSSCRRQTPAGTAGAGLAAVPASGAGNRSSQRAHQFARRERLGHVVVGASSEADHAIDLARARGEEDHRQPECAARQAAEQFEARLMSGRPMSMIASARRLLRRCAAPPRRWPPSAVRSRRWTARRRPCRRSPARPRRRRMEPVLMRPTIADAAPRQETSFSAARSGVRAETTMRLRPPRLACNTSAAVAAERSSCGLSKPFQSRCRAEKVCFSGTSAAAARSCAAACVSSQRAARA